INDIVAEVQKTVNSLHRQVTRARRHEELAKKLFEFEISTATHQFSRLLNELDPLVTTFTTLNKDYERITAKVNLYDADVEALKTQLIQTEQRLSSEQKKLTEINLEIQKKENEIVVSRERIKSIDENRDRDESEKNELVQRINGLGTAGENLKLQISSTQTELQEVDQTYSGQKEKLQLSEAALQGQRKQRQELETQQTKAQSDLTDLRKKQDRLSFELEMKRKQHQDACTNETGFAAELKSIQLELDKIENNYSALDVDIEKKQFEKEQLEETLEAHNEEVTALKKILFKGENKIDDFENRIQLLRQLIDSFEDYPEGVRHLMLESGKNNGFLGAIADHIHIPAEYRLPIEVFLGESSVYLLTNSLAEAQTGIEELRGQEKGFVNFVPLENPVSTGSKTAMGSELNDNEIISRCDKIIRYEPEFEAVLKPMFQCCYLVKSFDAAKRLVAEYGERPLSFVTLDGEMINTAGIVKGGKKPEKQGGPIGRLDELQKLENQQAELYDETEAAETKLDRLSQELERQNSQNKQLSQVLTELAQEKTKLQISLGQIKYRRQQHQAQVTGNVSLKEKLEHDITEIDSAQTAMGPEIERLQNMHETTVKELFELKQLLATKELENSALATQVHELNLNLVEKQGALSQIEHEMKQNTDLVQEFAHTIETKAHNIESGHSQKDELEQNTHRLNNALEAEFVSQDELELTVHRFEAERAELTRKTDEITRTIRGLRFDREQSSEKSHTLELKISEIKMKAQNIQQRILEEFEVEIKRASIDPEFNFQETHDELEAVRKRLKGLGPVNSFAIEEYDTEKGRLDFLLQQQNDLDEARNTLTDTIELINKEAQTRFLETFDEVQKNFREVFSGFFPHGAADILMTRSGDVLENEIELIANPKTKRMSALALLSGGEK
ncbi:hypothetical protein KAH55_13415, partial [bacterium]|nr:hypothetical protein [bacterium]